MSNAKLRWGVISTANIGRKAVNPAIQASSNGELLAVASRDVSRARECADSDGIPRAYGSYEELLADPDVDAVYNPLPNSLHLEWTVKAAEAGKHILCEKPLALNEAECREMAAAAEANGVKLLEAFMYRFHPRTQRVVEMIRDGVIGELQVMRSTFTFNLTRPENIRWDPELGGGALMDVGCYCVNLSRTIMGAEPEEVQGLANWPDRDVDADLSGILRFPEGMALMECALTQERSEVFEIMGTEGSMRVENAFLPGTDEVAIEVRRRGEPTRREMVKGADEYVLMVEHFADCVLNERSLRYSVDEAALNMRTIEALYRSARNDGTPVSL